jgi:hypothetical protein
MRGPWRPQTNIFYFVCVALVVIYLFHASWGLNHLDFSGYNKIYEMLEVSLLAVLGAYERSF